MTEVVDIERAPASVVERYEDQRSGIMALAGLPEREFEQRLAQLRSGQERLKRIHRELMEPDTDYGVIPGTQKPTLLKPGAEKLCQAYGLREQLVPNVQYGDGVTAPHITVVSECRLHLHSLDGPVVATGYGAASSWETRYRYRRGERTCPDCGAAAIRKSKEEYGGGWYCAKPSGGCGAKFGLQDTRISGQDAGNVENPDPYDLLNTILKMANKRAYVDGTLRATASSGHFSQDLEDGEQSAREPAPPRPRSAAREAPPQETPVRDARPVQGRVAAAMESASSYGAANGLQDTQPSPSLVCAGRECGKALTRGQYDVSMRAFGQPLCPACQKAEKAGGDGTPPPPHQRQPAASDMGPEQRSRARAFAVWAKHADELGLSVEDEMQATEMRAVLTQVLGRDVPTRTVLTPAEWDRLTAWVEEQVNAPAASGGDASHSRSEGR